MPHIAIQDGPSCEVEPGQRLVLAIEGCGVDIGHRCGGYARCTTCRVRFHAGEPETMTRAEYEKLKDRDLLGEARLSCQILVEHDMEIEALMRVDEMGWSDPGPPPETQVTPEPEWLDRATLAEQ